jgi:RNA polymerase sigma factor (sigma-70 family)
MMVLFRGMADDTQVLVVRSDVELVDLCLKGDQSAWAQLIARYQRLIYSVARTLCLDPDDVADVFQSTCLDLYQGLSELRDIKALPAWLMTVTRRRAVSHLKSKVPVLEAESQPDVTDIVKAIEREHEVERALEQMSERCRDLIDLLYFDANQPSYIQISEKLGIPVASIGPTRARCLGKLKKLLL